MTTVWRASGSYVASSALFGGLLDETRLYLKVFAEQAGTLGERTQVTRQQLVEGGLLQRARASRRSVVQRIQMRLTSWSPPQWVLDDLVSFAADTGRPDFLSAMLLHVCRQDALLYDLVQGVVAPRWRLGQRDVNRTDVQRFLDEREPRHPEILSWTHQTRDRLATMTLAILRDYGLLQGKVKKRISEPLASERVARYLVCLLRAEGVADGEIPAHPDWNIWLWTPERAAKLLENITAA